MINGKVVDESSEVEQIEERKKWAQVRAEMELMLCPQAEDEITPWRSCFMSSLFFLHASMPQSCQKCSELEVKCSFIVLYRMDPNMNNETINHNNRTFWKKVY